MGQECSGLAPPEPGNAFIYGRSPRSPSFGPFPQEDQLRIEHLPREPTGSACPMRALSCGPSRHVSAAGIAFPCWLPINLSTSAASSRCEHSFQELAANRKVKETCLATNSRNEHSHQGLAATETPAYGVPLVGTPSVLPHWQKTPDVGAHVGRQLPSAVGRDCVCLLLCFESLCHLHCLRKLGER